MQELPPEFLAALMKGCAFNLGKGQYKDDKDAACGFSQEKTLEHARLARGCIERLCGAKTSEAGKSLH